MFLHSSGVGFNMNLYNNCTRLFLIQSNDIPMYIHKITKINTNEQFS